MDLLASVCDWCNDKNLEKLKTKECFSHFTSHVECEACGLYLCVCCNNKDNETIMDKKEYIKYCPKCNMKLCLECIKNHSCQDLKFKELLKIINELCERKNISESRLEYYRPVLRDRIRCKEFLENFSKNNILKGE